MAEWPCQSCFETECFIYNAPGWERGGCAAVPAACGVRRGRGKDKKAVTRCGNVEDMDVTVGSAYMKKSTFV